MNPRIFLLVLALAAGTSALAKDANRLTYLDDPSPFWPGPGSPRLITPQWVGEPGVEAVVILAIDDLRDPEKYEAYLRPILDRLKKIDGRAPVSIMTNTVDPAHPRLQQWLEEGLSLEVHTLAHPCPCLGKMSLADAAATYHGGVDLLASIPGNQPVAFRMPCCDSMNSASPRFFTEIFPESSQGGHALAIDSSVFTLPPGDRFAKYFPAQYRLPMKVPIGDYAGFIEDYPFPYVVNGVCWEFPCMVPSDWESFNIQGPNAPAMLEDWKAALDRVVEQRGVFTAVFHPHGWSSAEQWVEFIGYAEQSFGKRVKFLTFRESLARLERNVLHGGSLRAAGGVRILDLEGNGFMDVLTVATTRVWEPGTGIWRETPSPAPPAEAVFGIAPSSGAVMLIAQGKAWVFREGAWKEDAILARGLPGDPRLMFRDFDGDGMTEVLHQQGILAWDAREHRWQPADYSLPDGCAPFDAAGRDNGLRFVDLNGDDHDDVIQSNDAGYTVHLWAGTVKANLGWRRGWPHLVAQGPAGLDAKVLPFVKEGRNYGAWFHKDAIVWQNEDVATPGGAESVRRTFREIIAFDVPEPRSPQAALESMRPRPGFVVELVAAEPLVQDPVAFEWDAQGRLWVAEMRDYPLGMDGQGLPGGVVKCLTDEDRDGVYDTATVFLEGLPFPTGVFPWRDGVLISAAPDLLWARDTTGDGRADEVRVLFTGFRPGNQQHRFNGFEWGLDGWIHGANGDSGGSVNGIDISGRDFRFRPDSGEFETESGQTQYGRRRDDWGNWFGNNNPTWLWHYTISEAYLRRNPKLAVKTTKQVLAAYPDGKRVFPASELPIRFNQPQSAGHVTSACSPAPYRDSLFGADYQTSVFICEPVHNAVHREVLLPDGATFTSRRAADEQDQEFLASTDPWFRPVCLRTGPDGALYMADFYRFVLEHPEWIAPETQSRLDLRTGEDKGRIYRVLPTGTKLRPAPDLAVLDDAALVEAMDSSNGWQRDTAHRLLVERQARETAPALRRLAASAPDPRVRVQAIAALATLGETGPGTLREALRDNDPRVRVQALRTAEAGPREILPDMLERAGDDEFLVRHQLALSLGAFPGEEGTIATLTALAKSEGEHPQMRVAILSSLRPDDELFAQLNQTQSTAPAPQVIVPQPSTADRAKVLAAYGAVAGLPGDAGRGRERFQQHCQLCHRLKGEGFEAGPDLGMVADKPVDWLLTAILDPNAAIEDRYRAQTLTLKSGATLTGLISAETANNLVLRLPGGVDMPVLREDVVSRVAGERSLMPEGYEGLMQPQDMADLLAWIRAR